MIEERNIFEKTSLSKITGERWGNTACHFIRSFGHGAWISGMDPRAKQVSKIYWKMSDCDMDPVRLVITRFLKDGRKSLAKGKKWPESDLWENIIRKKYGTELLSFWTRLNSGV